MSLQLQDVVPGSTNRVDRWMGKWMDDGWLERLMDE